MIIVPRSLVCVVGSWYFRTSKRFPNFFLIFPILGVVVGVWMSLFAEGAKMPRLVWIVLGVVLLLFYGMLIAVNLIKRSQGTWDAFCDSALDAFED